MKKKLNLIKLDADESAKHDGAEYALFLDNSAIEKWRCPRLFQHAVIDQRELVAAKAGRNFGSTVHIGFAWRYMNCGINPVGPTDEECINLQMNGWLTDNPQPLDDFRNYNHACVVMKAYNETYGKESFEIISTFDGKRVVEKPFAFWLANQLVYWQGVVITVAIIYCGKIDLAIRNPDGIWVLDHKTAFMFGEAFEAAMQMDGGQLGYVWALKQATGIMPRGYIIDAVRIRRPTKKSEYDNTAPVDASDFRRIPFFVYEESLNEWKRDVLAIATDICSHANQEYFPRHRWECTTKFGKCDFFDVCSTGLASREQALNSELYADSEWTPLEAPKKEMSLGEATKVFDEPKDQIQQILKAPAVLSDGTECYQEPQHKK